MYGGGSSSTIPPSRCCMMISGRPCHPRSPPQAAHEEMPQPASRPATDAQGTAARPPQTASAGQAAAAPRRPDDDDDDDDGPATGLVWLLSGLEAGLRLQPRPVRLCLRERLERLAVARLRREPHRGRGRVGRAERDQLLWLERATNIYALVALVGLVLLISMPWGRWTRKAYLALPRWRRRCLEKPEGAIQV
ncbi:hypothetical protein NUW54_g2000 [Trametes sanguinea]|uniref:Uncharacterized protein n=1 Tax=Trametes sanguinea TaxID=158606 RepID=A0ACC1Q5D6_9APHY|nr:hypothetical protein NUW54_g2000 [Trametes sanguinea]